MRFLTIFISKSIQTVDGALHFTHFTYVWHARTRASAFRWQLNWILIFRLVAQSPINSLQWHISTNAINSRLLLIILSRVRRDAVAHILKACILKSALWPRIAGCDGEKGIITIYDCVQGAHFYLRRISRSKSNKRTFDFLAFKSNWSICFVRSKTGAS